jgi:hypothetical protein
LGLVLLPLLLAGRQGRVMGLGLVLPLPLEGLHLGGEGRQGVLGGSQVLEVLPPGFNVRRLIEGDCQLGLALAVGGLFFREALLLLLKMALLLLLKGQGLAMGLVLLLPLSPLVQLGLVRRLLLVQCRQGGLELGQFLGEGAALIQLGLEGVQGVR